MKYGKKKKIENMIKKAVSLLKSKKVVPVPQVVDSQKLLDGKVALITGGGSGIGKAIAEAYINSGCKVIICGRNTDKLKECAENLGENAKYIQLDVSDVSSIQSKIPEAVSCFGRIDILVNSAGQLAHNNFFEMTEKEYDEIMDANAKGMYFMSQGIARYMIDNKIKGHILNISSSSALRPAWTPYQVSKWAVRGMTLGMADMLIPYGIVVNALAPGPVATPMLGQGENDSIYKDDQPSKRYATAGEIANMAVVLVSGMGDLVVGDTIYMTGGSGTVTLHN